MNHLRQNLKQCYYEDDRGVTSFDGDYTGDSDAANLYDDDPVGMVKSNDDSADACEQDSQTEVAKEGSREEEE